MPAPPDPSSSPSIRLERVDRRATGPAAVLRFVRGDGAAADPAAALEPASASRMGRAVEAVAQTLSAPAFSLDALRQTVVRYGRLARELALPPDEMLAALAPAVRRTLAGRVEIPADRRPDAMPAARPAELESWVQWWAIHGYHRAD